MSDEDLPSLLTWVAEECDGPAFPYAGVLRRAAREIVELRRQLAVNERSTPGGCRWCGRSLEQSNTGRPREFCSDAHRKAAGRKSGNARVRA